MSGKQNTLYDGHNAADNEQSPIDCGLVGHLTFARLACCLKINLLRCCKHTHLTNTMLEIALSRHHPNYSTKCWSGKEETQEGYLPFVTYSDGIPIYWTAPAPTDVTPGH